MPTFTLTTPLTPAQVRQVLEASVRRSAALSYLELRRWTHGPALVGETRDDGFTLRRRRIGRGAFVPDVHGEVRASATGSEVLVRVAIPRSVVALTVGFTALFAGLLVAAMLAMPADAPKGPAATLFMIPAVIPIATGATLRRETRFAREFLAKCLAPA